jgi:hypothetical protein
LTGVLIVEGVDTQPGGEQGQAHNSRHYRDE